MGTHQSHTTPAPTIWAVPDDVWPVIQQLLDAHDPAKAKGHRRVNRRRVRTGLICRLRTGCQWHRLPAAFGDDRTVPRHFQPWCQRGLFERLWAALVEPCAARDGVDGQWQAADTAMGKARTGGDLVGRHPTDRGQKGERVAWSSKRMAARWARPGLGPTSRTPSAWPPRWRPWWWSAPSPPRQRRRLAASIQAMTIPRAMKRLPLASLARRSGAWARRSSIRLGRRHLRRAAGWWNGRWHGGQSAGAASCAMTRTRSIS
jgi:transposase